MTDPKKSLTSLKAERDAADWEPDHEDFCRLSRAFNEVANIAMGSQDDRINEWLKRLIAGDAFPWVELTSLRHENARLKARIDQLDSVEF